MKYQHDGPGQRHPDEEGEQTSVELWNRHHRSLAFVGFSTGAYPGAECQALLDWLDPQQLRAVGLRSGHEPLNGAGTVLARRRSDRR